MVPCMVDADTVDQIAASESISNGFKDVRELQRIDCHS